MDSDSEGLRQLETIAQELANGLKMASDSEGLRLLGISNPKLSSKLKMASDSEGLRQSNTAPVIKYIC